MKDSPSFYNPNRIGTLFYPNMNDIAADASQANLNPVASEDSKNLLVIIDMQVDFCHPHGSLYIPGAEGDIQRLIAFIYRHAAKISHISCTLDSHLPFQIFHPGWWADETGRNPEPLTTIDQTAVSAGTWHPLANPEHSTTYVAQLENQAKKQLMIWPYHVLLGGLGNMLDPELWSAVMWHSLACQSQPTWIQKGTVPQTEHYSAIRPEILVPEHPDGGKNEAFLASLRQADKVFIAGEASSHCVLETLQDIVNEFGTTPTSLQKFYVLEDCMSPVQHPAVDFATLTKQKFAEFAQQGLRFINSNDPFPG